MASYIEALSGTNNNTEQNNDNDVNTNDTNDNQLNSASASASNSTVGEKVPAECIKGIQRIREMNNEEDKLSLLVQGINLRGRQIALHSQNPHNPSNLLQPDTIGIKVKNVPLSADDGQIRRAKSGMKKNDDNAGRSQQSIDKFMSTPNNQRGLGSRTHSHTPPTPTEALHDRTSDSHGPKKAKAK
ncbi:Hypothetical predicted protein [Mytilus galloprovincialis]|uniref:Uncharacterized protein n=1 Tax=Mytilus galloprovincialis TaxID=29158 RepID=A0A8B6HJN0_MYTGA|nr:Hypothetical predicted protein [Mytilus galloprovincialis]